MEMCEDKAGKYFVPHFGICPVLKWCCTILEFQNGVPNICSVWCGTIDTIILGLTLHC